MPTDDANLQAAAWAEACLAIKLPAERLAVMAPAARRVVDGVAAEAGKLAMEDEPASFTAGLNRLAGAAK